MSYCLTISTKKLHLKCKNGSTNLALLHVDVIIGNVWAMHGHVQAMHGHIPIVTCHMPCIAYTCPQVGSLDDLGL